MKMGKFSDYGDTDDPVILYNKEYDAYYIFLYGGDGDEATISNGHVTYYGPPDTRTSLEKEMGKYPVVEPHELSPENRAAFERILNL